MIKRAFICGGLILIAWHGLSAESITGGKGGVFLGERYEETAAMQSGQTLIVNSAATLSGSLKIIAGGEDCRIRYRKRLKATTKKEAAAFAEAISVDVEKNKDGITISLRSPSSAPWSGTKNSGRLDVEITIPDSSSVQFNTAYFDIDAVGPFTEFIVSESLSKVQVEKVTGVTEVRVSSRPFSATDISGRLFISNEYGRIKLENIDTGEKSGTIRNEHGEVTVSNYRGRLDLGTSYDRITARNLFLTGAGNRVKNTSGPIMLSFDSLTTGKIRVNNRYGQISIDIAGRVDARFICKNGKSSRIVAEHMTMEPTIVDDNRLEFIAGKGMAEVRIYTNGDGDIIINGPDRNNVNGGI